MPRTPRPVAQPATTAAGRTGARIRMYRVGFGDFFLLSIPKKGGAGYAHVLIDCGVHAKDLGSMPDALKLMQAETGGQLALVIMTHRHADHISGFASGKAIFAGFKVERVWMSWFEDPKNEKAKQIQAGLAADAERLQAALAARAAPGDDEYADMAGNILGIGGAGGSNQVALGVLHGFKTPGNQPTPVDYYSAGQPAQLPQSLVDAGLTAQILGPPTDLTLVKQMDNNAHQYLTATDDDAEPAPAPFARAYIDPAYREPRRVLFSAREIEKHIADSQPDMLAAAAQSADNAINNQSLVVLFGYGGKTMLFCGDAQWGNWANFLFGGPAGAAGAGALTPNAKGILGSLDFLKVGHHGSTNATPRDVVAALKLGCCAMCSTQPGAYGKPDAPGRKGTEVPRTPLMAALKQQTQGRLARSDQVAVAGTPADASLGTLDAAFAAGPNGQFIDYLL